MKKIFLILMLFAPLLALGQTTKIRSTTSLPATCSPGDGIQPSDEVALVSGGATVLYICRATNVWVASGLPDPGSNGIVFRNTLLGTRVATSADLVGLFTGCGGTQYLGADGACHNLVTSFNSRTGAVLPVANDYTWDQIGAGTNLNALLEGAAGSLAPTANGQIAGTQAWMQPGLVAPTAASSNSGGSLNSAHATFIVYTLNSALGETLPSAEVSGSNIGGFGAGCTSGASCSITVTAPTIPSGYTGYTVYSRDCNTLTTCAGPELKQTASSNCVNITGNCVIQVGGAGANYPTTNTAIVTPPSVQAGFVPLGASPSWFFPKTNGQYFPLAGVDFSSGSPLPSPDGTFEFWHRVFVNDSGQNLAGATQQGGGCIRNTLFSLCHLSGQTTSTGSSTDDRVFSYRGTDSLSSPTYEQWLGIYGEHFVYNNNFACSPIGGLTPGTGEDCVAALRVRVNDQRSAGVNNATFIGVHGIASTNVASPKLGSCLPCVVGVVGSADQETVTNQNASNAYYAGVLGAINASSGNTNGNGFSLWAKPPTTRFAGQNGGLFIEGGFSNTNDWAIRSDATSRSKWLGPMLFGNATHAFGTDAGTMNVYGSIAVQAGSLTSTAFATPTFTNGNVSHAGTGGAATWTYKVVATDGNGGTTAASAAGSTSTGNATIDTNNFNIITMNFCNAGVPFGWSNIKVYRTASGGTPSSTGLIGTITPSDLTSGGAALTTCNATLNDTGLAGDSSTPPTTNATGGISSGGDFAFNANKGQHVTTQAANNDHAGTCTLASGSCTVTFTRAYTSAPVCVATPSTTGTFTTGAALKVNPSTSNVVISSTTGTDTAVVDYVCVGNPN